MIGWMVQNAVVATGLALLVWGVCRWRRLGPAARHGLWLLVLIKLVTPGVVAWPWAVGMPVSGAAGDVAGAGGRHAGSGHTPCPAAGCGGGTDGRGGCGGVGGGGRGYEELGRCRGRRHAARACYFGDWCFGASDGGWYTERAGGVASRRW